MKVPQIDNEHFFFGNKAQSVFNFSFSSIVPAVCPLIAS